jgi:hypothetical protein
VVNTADPLYGQFGYQPEAGQNSGFGSMAALYLREEALVFKFMLFFMLMLALILAFVTWVMGIPLPGIPGYQPPATYQPFNP